MTKKSYTLMFFTMLLTSVIVSAGTFTGAVWYMKNHNSFDLSEMVGSLSFQEETRSEQSSFHSLDKLVLSVKGQRQTHFVMLELAVETHQPERSLGTHSLCECGGKSIGLGKNACEELLDEQNTSHGQSSPAHGCHDKAKQKAPVCTHKGHDMRSGPGVHAGTFASQG